MHLIAIGHKNSRVSQMALVVKNLPASAGDFVESLGQ